jgi:endogenous inhibitor of DNA gyrase (YacG/DUF329 family)
MAQEDNTLQCEGCGKLVDTRELRAFSSWRCELCVLAGNKPKPEYRNPVWGEDTDE